MAPEVDLDLIFCMTAKKYNLEKLQLKSIAIVESSLNPRAFRFEQGFWDLYLKNNPEWKDRDPQEVSSSRGLFQLMYTTAVSLGFPKDGPGEDLFNPVYNTELAAKLIRQLLDKNYGWWDVVLSCYNSGQGGNPAPDGSIRSIAYINKVRKTYWNLRKTEENCD